MDNLDLVIGLEMHCELKSNSKVFSRGKNQFSEEANVFVSPVDMAFPGILPVVNKRCVEEAIEMALILNCDIANYLLFDRKNYYYPDLPKGYQITQCHKPIGTNGHITFNNGHDINVIIHDLHLEEDAASLDHFANTSTIDYNRSGVPLIEIVTDPCFTSAEDALCFLENMRSIYQYTNISDADTKRGQIRCDVNVNLRNKDGVYVTPRVEVKNVNGFTNIYDTIKYEEERQRNALKNNQLSELVQETRRFDEETGTTIRMRNKVDAIDYKYFIEPNIPPYKINTDWIQKIKESIPELAQSRKEKYLNNYGLSEYDATTLIKNKNISDYFNECLKLGMDAKIASNWITVNIMGELNKDNSSIKNFYLTPILLKQLIDNISAGTISSKQAKEIFAKAIIDKKEPNSYISKDNGQISDQDELTIIIKDIINNNLSQKEAYLNGRSNVFDYFVGQVMKNTRGKANPTITKELLHIYLEK